MTPYNQFTTFPYYSVYQGHDSSVSYDNSLEQLSSQYQDALSSFLDSSYNNTGWNNFWNAGKSEAAANTAKEYLNNVSSIYNNAITMQYNAQQAQLNRDFQEHMSSTAYQRAMKDLASAGLNPLAVSQLGSSSTPSGSSASAHNASYQSNSREHNTDALVASIFNNIISSAVKIFTS